MKEQIVDLLKQGKQCTEIASIVGCAKATVSYHAKLNGFQKYSQTRYNWEEISQYQNEGHSVAECQKEFNVNTGAWHSAAKRGVIKSKDNSFIFTKVNHKINSMRLKNAFLKTGVSYQCAICSIFEWQNKPLTLQLDHIDGDNTNNNFDNLRLLCANCHTQTDTYAVKNCKKYKNKIHALVIALASNE